MNTTTTHMDLMGAPDARMPSSRTALDAGMLSSRIALDAGMLVSSREAALVVGVREGRMLALDVDARAMDAGLTASMHDARPHALPAAAQLGAAPLNAGALWLVTIDEDALEALGLGAAPLDASALEHLDLAAEHSHREAKALELLALEGMGNDRAANRSRGARA